MGHRQPAQRLLSDTRARERIAQRIVRLQSGLLGDVKPIGGGLSELRIDYGPGYRVYFGKDGEQIVILLGGGTKQRQQNDIGLALGRWEDYKQRKKRQKEG